MIPDDPAAGNRAADAARSVPAPIPSDDQRDRPLANVPRCPPESRTRKAECACRTFRRIDVIVASAERLDEHTLQRFRNWLWTTFGPRREPMPSTRHASARAMPSPEPVLLAVAIQERLDLLADEMAVPHAEHAEALP